MNTGFIAKRKCLKIIEKTGYALYFLAVLGMSQCLTADVKDLKDKKYSEWVNISDGLLKNIQGYSDDIPGARRIGGTAVDRHSGDVFLVLNGPPFGLYRSSDAGLNWKRVDKGEVTGGWTRSYSICMDQDNPGRMAIFRSIPPLEEGKNVNGYIFLTLDNGQTWNTISNNPRKIFNFGGYRHGMVDWQKSPLRVITQNRVRPQLLVSEDCGKKWESITNKKLGPIYDSAVLLDWYRNRANSKSNMTRGYGLASGAILIAKDSGIERSTDQGKTYEKISDFLVNGVTPIRFKERLYWAAEKGVIVSSDEGLTWSLLGTECRGAKKGPFFGKDANALVIVTDTGVFQTADAGAHWKKISDLFIVPDAYRRGEGPLLLWDEYAWDHKRNILYISGFAGSAYKKEITK